MPDTQHSSVWHLETYPMDMNSNNFHCIGREMSCIAYRPVQTHNLGNHWGTRSNWLRSGRSPQGRLTNNNPSYSSHYGSKCGLCFPHDRLCSYWPRLSMSYTSLNIDTIHWHSHSTVRSPEHTDLLSTVESIYRWHTLNRNYSNPHILNSWRRNLCKTAGFYLCMFGLGRL